MAVRTLATRRQRTLLSPNRTPPSAPSRLSSGGHPTPGGGPCRLSQRCISADVAARKALRGTSRPLLWTATIGVEGINLVRHLGQNVVYARVVQKLARQPLAARVAPPAGRNARLAGHSRRFTRGRLRRPSPEGYVSGTTVLPLGAHEGRRSGDGCDSGCRRISAGGRMAPRAGRHDSRPRPGHLAIARRNVKISGVPKHNHIHVRSPSSRQSHKPPLVVSFSRRGSVRRALSSGRCRDVKRNPILQLGGSGTGSLGASILGRTGISYGPPLP
jgi:hypothetical protein